MLHVPVPPQCKICQQVCVEVIDGLGTARVAIEQGPFVCGARVPEVYHS